MSTPHHTTISSPQNARSPRPSTAPPGVARPREALRSVLVATHGGPSATGALRAADLLARHCGATVDVVSVSEPLPTGFTPVPYGLGLVPDTEQLRAAIADSITTILGAPCRWPIVTVIGSAAPTICRIGNERHTDLVILGRGRHHLIDRVVGPEIAMHVIREATIPVLATENPFDHLPMNILIGTDFSRASIRAAHRALDLMGTGARVHVVHVRTAFEPFPSAPDEPDEIYATGIHALFDAFEAALDCPSGVEVARTILDGDPASELLDYAEQQHIDLVAVGSHGRSSAKRRILGSVATHLVRSVNCSLLVSGLARTPSVS